VLLAVGRLVYLSGDTDKPLALVGELCPHRAGENEIAWRQAWLAGEALVEMGLNRVRDSALGRDLAERLRHRLVDLIRQGRLSAVERAAAGRTLARLDDPRFRADTWYLPDEPLLGFVEVPAGPFLMGTREEDIPTLLEQFGGEREWYEWEVPRHEVTLPAYYVARYPVTNAQYLAFVTDTGHRPPTADIDLAPPYEWRDGQPPSHLLNAPVVLVTWYDAQAYCSWLTEQLRTWEGVPEPLARLLHEEDWVVRLPTEAEWEKAARGSDSRIFPWGDEPDPNRANYGDSGIGSTSAVGCFPGGASPYGVLDMAGNVWEWCHSLYQSYPYKQEDGREDSGAEGARVLRGGSFNSNERYVRCAFRGGDYPVDGYNGYGFRICVAPGL
jgi:formylglycine-generating enzyme required for sulfatase activity